jgi:hypothetical protein
MIVDRALKDKPPGAFNRMHPSKRDAKQAQEAIYSFLLDAVRTWPAAAVLEEFKRLFIHHVDTVSSTTLPALYEIVFANDEQEFRNTLKRSCYILINNWETSREHQAIQDLVAVFEDPIIYRRTVSPTLKRLRAWLIQFVEGQDYADLKLFISRYTKPAERHWSARYTSYLLTSQYADADNPIEQREAARIAAQRMRDKFKLDLAMYTAKSQMAISRQHMPENPTGLGDEVLRLIKTIVMRRGTFSYTNLASIFLKQTEGTRYENFKKSLLKYIVFSLPQEDIVAVIQQNLGEKLDALYDDHHDEEINDALLLRTCNRVIEYLTTEDRRSPSQLFCLLLASNNPLPLVSVLLKIILICRNSRTHLEARIADLIRFYEDSSQDECQWVINFFEVFNVTFTIYTENVEYSLVAISQMRSRLMASDQASNSDLNAYRIFSQLRQSTSPFVPASEEEQEEIDQVILPEAEIPDPEIDLDL